MTYLMRVSSLELILKGIVCALADAFFWSLLIFKDTETGPGVYETALAYTSALRMADNAILYKFLTKSIGVKYGIVPSFMAKPWGNVNFSCS